MLPFGCEETALDTAYHEAGHAVVGIGLGIPLAEVHILPDTTGRVEWAREGCDSSIAQYRRSLIVTVAGPYAVYRHWDYALSDFLVSSRICQGEAGNANVPCGDETTRCDVWQGIYAARAVCRRLKLQDEGRWDEGRVHNDLYQRSGGGERYWGVSGVTPPEVTTDEILAEVVRAERWAKKLLRRRWSAVEEVAEALFNSPEGVLSGDEVMELVAGAGCGSSTVR